MSKYSGLLKKSSNLFLSTILANICNFLFQLYMGRGLSPEDFGVMNSLLSFFIITTVPTATIQMVVTKYVSVFNAAGETSNIRYFLLKVLKKTLTCLIIVVISFSLLAGNIASFLKIPSVIPVIILGVLLLISFILPILIGGLQGVQNFRYVAATATTSSIFRLLLGVLFVSYGFKVNGALSGIVLATAISIVIAAYPLLYILKYKGAATIKKGIAGEVFSYSLYVMAATICFNLLTNIDVIMVKHYFSPELAGVYSSAVVLGRTILYLPSVISVVMFPMVSEAASKDTDVFKLFNQGVLYTLLLSLTGFMGFIICPKFILNLLYGGKFNDSVGLLQLFSFSMIFMAIMNVIMNFNLARHKKDFIYSMVSGSLLQITIMVFFHDTLNQIIYANIVAGVFVILYNWILIIKERKEVKECLIKI